MLVGWVYYSCKLLSAGKKASKPCDRSMGSLVPPRLLSSIIPYTTPKIVSQLLPYLVPTTPWPRRVWLAVCCNFPALFALLLFPFHAVTR
jgi:hypothetical protein